MAQAMISPALTMYTKRHSFMYNIPVGLVVVAVVVVVVAMVVVVAVVLVVLGFVPGEDGKLGLLENCETAVVDSLLLELLTADVLLVLAGIVSLFFSFVSALVQPGMNSNTPRISVQYSMRWKMFMMVRCW